MSFNSVHFITDVIRHGRFRPGPVVAAGLRTSASLGTSLVLRRGPYRWPRPAVAGLLLVLGMTPPVFAQAPSDHGGAYFRTLGWGVTRDDLYYSLDGEDTGLRIFDSVRSGFHAYPKGGEISFYRVVLNEDGEEERVTVARGDLTDGGPTPLLIMTKSEKEPDKLNMRVIADDLTAFPERTCRFVNFTPIEIGVTVGPKEAAVPPGGIRLVDTHLGEDERTRYVTAFVSVSDDKLMLSYNNWVFRSGQRVMVFIALDKGGQPRVIRLVDAVAPIRTLLNPDDSG